MVLLDRSKLRLKAATAKLKKQRQCNMSHENAQTEPGISHKKAQKAQKTQKRCPELRRLIVLPEVDGRAILVSFFFVPFVIFVPFVARFRC